MAVMSGSSRGGSGPRPAALDRFVNGSQSLLNVLAGCVFILMILTIFFAVIFREALQLPYPWVDDVARFLMIWSIYLGAATLTLRNQHISIDVLYSRLPKGVQRLVDAAVALLGILLAAASALPGWRMTWMAVVQGERSMTTFLPAWVGYLAIPVGFGLCALGYLVYLFIGLRGKGTPAERHPLTEELPS